ncbi:plasmid mobilization protein [Amnibacterium soli]
MSDEAARGPVFGRRRRANADGEGSRAKRYVVKVTPEEDLALRSRAAVRDVTVARLLFESAMDAGIVTAAERKQAIVMLFKLQRQMASVANNANQIARYANTEGRFPAEATSVLAEYRAVVAEIREAMAAVNRT